MSSHLQAQLFRQFYPDIVRYYVIDDFSLERLKNILKQRDPRLQMTDAQWKTKFVEHGIYKNNNYADAEFVLESLERIGVEVDRCLIIADGILLDIRDLEEYFKRTKTSPAIREQPLRAQQFIFVLLPFPFSVSNNLEFFKGFRRLLWYTRLHFDICFGRGIWSMDENGVYGRSKQVLLGLQSLSRLHNMVCDALKHWRRGNHRRFWAAINTAHILFKSVVQTYHHRQFPDLLAISLLFERHDLSDVRVMIARNICGWAQDDAVGIELHDPRRRILEEIVDLPIDRQGHLYLAYDACCRELWMARASGTNHIKAYFGYNQASLPRSVPGKFYDLFKGKTFTEVQDILRQVDLMFTTFDHPRACLWHTAIRYLLQEHRYEDAEAFGATLGKSLVPESYLPELYQGQLNVNTSLTFFLLGSAESSLGKPLQALRSFLKCVEIRSIVVADSDWDPTLAGAIEKLEILAEQVGDARIVEDCKRRSSNMYLAMEQNQLAG